MNAVDRLARQHRGTPATTKRHASGGSAYRASGFVPQGTAVIARRPFEVARSPKRSPKILPR